jgi:hypothetical protein
VDGFDQDKAESKRDERAVILRRLLTSKCDTFEALEFADRLFDACPRLVKCFWKEGGHVFGVGSIRDCRAYSALACGTIRRHENLDGFIVIAVLIERTLCSAGGTIPEFINARGFFTREDEGRPHEGHPLVASAYRQRVSPDRWAGTMPPFGVKPFRNLKRSLSVERTRVVFSAIMDL